MSNEEIRTAWSKLNPDDEGIQRIMSKIHTGREQRKSRISVKTLLIAAAIIALTVVTVFAGSSTIREIIIGGSRATQVETVENPNITHYAHLYSDGVRVETRILDSFYFRVNNPDRYTPAITSQRGSIFTVEEANRYAPFTIAEPTFIPEHLHLGEILLPRFDEETYAFGAMLLYHNESGIMSLILVQRYVGPEGYFVLESTHPIKKIMIGDAEALLLINENGGANSGQVSRQLKWISDGTFFELMNTEAYDIEGNDLGLSLEILVAIAESIK